MKRLIPALFLLIAALLAACSGPQATLTAPAEPTAGASATPAPSSTPTPLPGRAVLLAPDSVSQAAAAEAQALLVELAAPAGLTVETAPALEPSALTAEVKLVAALARPANLPDLLAAAPQAQFVVLSGEPLEPAVNLTVIRLQPEQQAFVAGYLATILSDDWRAGGLIPSESPALQEAFANGGRYFCGVCAPGWPLGVNFPLAAGAAAPADGPAWAAVAADFFDNGKVESFYLSEQAARPEVIAYLAGRAQFETTVVVTGALPPPDELRGQWAATVGFDSLAALRQALPEALAGRSMGSISAPLSLSNVNPDVLSPGRQELVEGIMKEVAAGLISPLSVP